MSPSAYATGHIDVRMGLKKRPRRGNNFCQLLSEASCHWGPREEQIF